jgi:hypothetical protein
MKLTVVCVCAGALSVTAAGASADPLTCNLSAYKPASGLTASSTNNSLTVTWTGDRNQQLRLRFTVESGTPTIQELAIRKSGGSWGTLASNAVPDYRIVSGLRRMSNQQMAPLRELGVELTPAVVDTYRWDPFWDAPLDLGAPNGRGGNPPPAAGVANQPGLPRKPEEIKRATATYHATRCAVKTNGARIEITFPGVQLGVFSGSLQYSLFRGSNLIQQEILAETRDPWVAYKYDAGLQGLSVSSGARIAWRDTANDWQEYRFDTAKNDEVPLKTSGRMVIAERGAAGSLVAFPPPHTFFWAREVAINLGYNWYRRDGASFAFGIRQPEHEVESEGQANFALYSARPGTTQHLTLFLYATTGRAEAAYDEALAFTHGDRYKPLAGYQVMNHHYHMDLGQRLLAAGRVDADIPDLTALKSLGITIVSQIDSIIGGRGGDQLRIRHSAIEGAKRHSDPNFLVMPDQEYYGSPLGGHTDLLFSHPVYWTEGRAANQPLADPDPTYGTVYHIGGADDLMEMARREDMLINMPHPRTKGSTGYPDAIKDRPFFNDPRYQGVGFRWGMGLDRSEIRLCEYRCLPLLDDMNNWVADKPEPPKYILSISEVRHQQPGDEIYASAPVTYVKLDSVPKPDEASAVIHALMRGDSFVTSGEVLIPSYAVRGSGRQRTIAADVEWTFPLNFVEVVWGDGVRTDRQIVSTTDLAPMGQHHFEIRSTRPGRNGCASPHGTAPVTARSVSRSSSRRSRHGFSSTNARSLAIATSH